MLALDSTFIIDLYWKDSPRHENACKWLEKLSESGEEVCIYYNCFNEFIHVITDSRRFGNAFTMKEALEVVEQWRMLENVKILFPHEQSFGRTAAWLDIYNLGRKRLNDTNMASCYELAGVTQILTANPADFGVFEALEAVVYN